MATHKSALKRHRQSEKRNEINMAAKTRVRKAVKAVLDAVEANDREAAGAALKAAIPVIQRVAGKGVIHGNTASRKISRLTLRVNGVVPQAAGEAKPKKPAKKPVKSARK